MEGTPDFKIKVVIPASGMGTRLGGEMPKQFLDICGEPILKHTLQVFDSCSFVDEISVAVPEEYIEEVRGYGLSRVTHIVAGMSQRANSVYAALEALQPFEGVVLVHDGIRIFVTEDLIRSVANAAYEHGAAVAGVPVIETVKKVDESGLVISTPDRRRLWLAQTPQGFRYNLLVNAYSRAAADGVLEHATDDSSLIERLGHSVRMVQGDLLNMKITSMMDYKLAQALSKDKWVS